MPWPSNWKRVKTVLKGYKKRKKEPVSISETETDWSDWSWQLSLSRPRWGHSTKLNGSQFFSGSADKQMASFNGVHSTWKSPRRSLSLSSMHWDSHQVFVFVDACGYMSNWTKPKTEMVQFWSSRSQMRPKIIMNLACSSHKCGFRGFGICCTSQYRIQVLLGSRNYDEFKSLWSEKDVNLTFLQNKKGLQFYFTKLRIKCTWVFRIFVSMFLYICVSIYCPIKILMYFLHAIYIFYC